MPGMCAVRKGFFSCAMSGPPGRADNDRVVLKFSAIIEATADDAERAAEAMHRRLFQEAVNYASRERNIDSACRAADGCVGQRRLSKLSPDLDHLGES